MKIVMQRVKKAAVFVNGREVSSIGRGVCLLVGIMKGDLETDADYLAEKVTGLRIFSDNEGKMNLCLGDIGGEILAVSQFTLAGSVRKGRRPSFDGAEAPERAGALFSHFIRELKKKGNTVRTGVFGALMEISLVNDGPVTFILEK